MSLKHLAGTRRVKIIRKFRGGSRAAAASKMERFMIMLTAGSLETE